MDEVFICDAVRTAFGRYGGMLSSVRADDLAAIPVRALVDRNPQVDWSQVDDVIYGCANQSGEDNRNVARMALLLAGLPEQVTGSTINRLCGSSLDAVAIAARAIKCGETHLMIAGGVESMSRAPFVLSKSETAFGRTPEIFDTTIGWRFVNPFFKKHFGIDSMPETAENVAEEFGVSREDQDAFALRSQRRWAAAQKARFFDRQIVPVTIAQKKGESKNVTIDEHPRPDTSPEALAKLPSIVKASGTVTAGNAAGINDGSGAVLLASERGLAQHQLTPRARVVASATTGVAPRIMGIAPISATQKILRVSGLELSQMDVIELNEAFAAQALAVTWGLGLEDDAERVIPMEEPSRSGIRWAPAECDW